MGGFCSRPRPATQSRIEPELLEKEPSVVLVDPAKAPASNFTKPAIGNASSEKKVLASSGVRRPLCSTMDQHQEPPADELARLVELKLVIPCEWHGVCATSKYHSNVCGATMGFSDSEARRLYAEKCKKTVASYGSWERLDLAKTNADWAMRFGSCVLGEAFSHSKLKKRLEVERANMVGEYDRVVEAVRKREPAEYERLVSHEKYATFSRNKQQETNDLTQLYAGALGALPELWKVASACRGSTTTWSVKKLLRAQTKMNYDYDGQPKMLADVARVSIVCDDLSKLLAALDILLSLDNLIALKNRWAKPLDGYVDVLCNYRARCNGHVCEIQLHAKSVYSLKGDGGHQQYKWLRRLVQPEDVYEGETDADGLPHGEGRKLFAAGDSYRGGYCHGVKSGAGRYECADGTVYEGGYVNDKKEGYGILTWSNGNRYEGEFRGGKMEGRGKKTLVDGSSYDGQWEKGKPEGRGIQLFKAGDENVSYSGTFVKGQKVKGKLDMANGDSFQGLFLFDKMSDGVLTRKNGDVMTGKFLQAGTVLQGTLQRLDGSTAEGRFEIGTVELSLARVATLKQLVVQRRQQASSSTVDSSEENKRTRHPSSRRRLSY